MIETFNKAINFDDLKDSGLSTFDPDKRLKSKDIKQDEAIFDIRNYGLKEASAVTKEIFTPEVINSEWKNYSEPQRQETLEIYGTKIAEVLGIEFKGVCFTSLCDSCFCWGCSEGRGQICVTPNFLTTPKYLIEGINTIAHEVRHEYQDQALKNPGKYNLDEKTQKEWSIAKEIYTLAGASELDPFGYEYNALELDARHFGEGIINELQRDMV